MHALTFEAPAEETGGDFIGGSLGDKLRGLPESEGGKERLVLFLPQKYHRTATAQYTFTTLHTQDVIMSSVNRKYISFAKRQRDVVLTTSDFQDSTTLVLEMASRAG